MPYIRLTIAKPRRGEEQRFEDLMVKLTDLARTTPGCTEAYLLKPHDRSGELARIAIYVDEASAEQLANSDTVLSLRSELHLLCEPGHTERAFFTM